MNVCKPIISTAEVLTGSLGFPVPFPSVSGGSQCTVLQQTPLALIAEPLFMFYRREEPLLAGDVEMFFILFPSWGCPNFPGVVRRVAELGCCGDGWRLAWVSACSGCCHRQCQCWASDGEQSSSGSTGCLCSCCRVGGQSVIPNLI